METAKVFWSGRSQAVRLPKAFRFDAAEVRIRRQGSAVVLEPIETDEWAWLDALEPLDDDAVAAALEDPGVRYLLDTNVVIGLLAKNSALRLRSREIGSNNLAISVIVAHELYFGACRGVRRDASMATLAGLRLPILPFDNEDAIQAGEIRAALAEIGKPIGPYDVLIAGQARARDLVLVTHNISEFSRVSGLRVEDWDG
jgi:tRNA(fMet)-specific endonuclease VapC